MRFIVIDGLDGSGKTSIAHWVAEHYGGEDTLVRNHPSDSVWGRISGALLMREGKVALVLATLFFIIDVLWSVSRLRTWSRRYDNVIFVRYLLGTAYLPRRLVPGAYHAFASILPVPRRMLLVDIDPEVAANRIESRRDDIEVFENLQSLKKVRSKMMLVVGGWEVVDNSGAIEETRQAVLSILDEWDSSE